MTRFKRLQLHAEQHNVILEKVDGSDPYEMYNNDDHGTVAICRTLDEVEDEMSSLFGGQEKN